MERFKQTEIGMIPEDWEVKSCEECMESIIDYRGKTPKKSIKKVIRTDSQNQIINNQSFHKFVTDGIPVEYKTKDGIKNNSVFLFDFKNTKKEKVSSELIFSFFVKLSYSIATPPLPDIDCLYIFIYRIWIILFFIRQLYFFYFLTYIINIISLDFNA